MDNKQKYRDSLEQLKDKMNAIEAKFSTNTAFLAYKAERKSKGRVVAKTTKRKRAAESEGKPLSKRVLHWKKFVQVLPVVPEYDRGCHSDLVKYCLMQHLKQCGYDFILNEFMYNNSLMDVFASAGNRAVEFEIKLSREDYLTDFSKLYYMGWDKASNRRRMALKHAVLEEGDESFISRFFFVVPENMIDVSECPLHAGLIWFTRLKVQGDHDLITFRIVKTPPVLHRRFIPPFTYSTIAKRLYLRTENLTDKYKRSIFKNAFKNATATPDPITDQVAAIPTQPGAITDQVKAEDHPESSPDLHAPDRTAVVPANPRKVNKRGSDIIQDTGGPAKRGRIKKKTAAPKVQPVQNGTVRGIIGKRL